MACTALNATNDTVVGQLNGLRLAISNGDRDNDILFVHGEITGSCENFILDTGSFIEAIFFVSDGKAITGFALLTSANVYKQYGVKNTTSTIKGYRFTAAQPWMGVYGTQSLTNPTSFGAVSIEPNCDFSYLKGAQTAQTTTLSSQEETQHETIELSNLSIEEQYQTGSNVVIIVVVIIIIVIIIFGIVCVMFYLKRKSVKKHPAMARSLPLNSLVPFDESLNETQHDDNIKVEPKQKFTPTSDLDLTVIPS